HQQLPDYRGTHLSNPVLGYVDLRASDPCTLPGWRAQGLRRNIAVKTCSLKNGRGVTMKRILVFALLCAVWTIRASGQEPSAPPQTPDQQSATDQQTAADQQNATDQADAAREREKQSERLHSSREVLKVALNEKSGISKNLTDNAKCVIVIPSVKKFAIGFGVNYGKGAMTCRLGENFNGPWSAPSM